MDTGTGELTRGGIAKGESVGNSFEATLAHKIGADVPRDLVSHAGESLDDPEALAMEEMAELMVRNGVERRMAVKSAAAIYEMHRLRDAVAAKTVVVGSVDAVCAVGDALRADMVGVESAEAMDRLIEADSRAFAARDSKLAIGCKLFAMGKPPYGFYSHRRLADALGVSPEAVSNEVEKFQEILGLPRTNQQKSEKALQSYARSNGALGRKTGDETS